MRAQSTTRKSTSLLRDETGTIITIEMVLIATTLVIGVLVSLVATRDAVISELSDVAGAIQDINQSYTLNSIVGHSAATHGADFIDESDFCDSAEDQPGIADNCIVFDRLPTDEGEEPSSTFVLSEIGTFSDIDFTTGVGGSATGTFGDGTIDTGFSVTTDTGNIAGTTGGSEVRFRESPGNAGTFIISYDEPVTELELWIRDLANIDGEPENLLGNFVVTLSDGTVLNNADFMILPDAITANQDFGEFSTRANNNSLLTEVTRGGLQYVTDPLFNGTGDQAAGRLVFPGVPTVTNPPGVDAVGIQSIQFDRSGGPSASFQATFSTSGRVLQDTAP